jgi:hypothetical protein
LKGQRQGEQNEREDGNRRNGKMSKKDKKEEVERRGKKKEMTREKIKTDTVLEVDRDGDKER